MHYLLFFCTALFSYLTFAETIITDTVRLDKLNKNLRENKFYLQVGPVKREIFYFEIGFSETPFYERNSEAKVFYKNENQCFELTVYEDKNIARKANCIDKAQDLYLEGFEDFRVTEVKDLVTQGFQSFRIQDLNQKFKLLAYIQPYSDINRENQSGAPTQVFYATLSDTTDVILKKNSIELLQVANLKVDKIGFLPERSIQSTQSIVPITNALIFSNEKGKVLLYNPYVSPAYANYELTIDPKITNYLASLEAQSTSAPVCYRDNYLSPSPSDCQKMIFDSHPKMNFKKIKILSIDFINQTVEFLN